MFIHRHRANACRCQDPITITSKLFCKYNVQIDYHKILKSIRRMKH